MTAARKAGLEFIPSVYTAVHLGGCLEHAGTLWDVTAWMPGCACAVASEAEVWAACTALARLHRVWQSLLVSTARCPAIESRLERLRLWNERVGRGCKPAFPQEFPELAEPLERGWRLVQKRAPEIGKALQPWTEQPLPLQPCLCDVRAENVLFEGTRVSGVVDFDAARLDHVAVDLARLLGTMAGDNASLRRAGLDAYRQVRHLSPQEEALVDALDRTGTLLAIVGWLLWSEQRLSSLKAPLAVTRRLASLIARVESWG